MEASGIPDDGTAALAATRALIDADSIDPAVAAAAVDSRFLAQRVTTRKRLTEVFSAALHDVVAITRDRPALISIDEIDSFVRVSDVPSAAIERLQYPLQVYEDHVKAAIHSIIGEPFATPHSSAEISDINSTRVQLGGRRTAAAFLLKGKGLGKPVMQVQDLGSQGNQIVKLSRSEADLLVVQYVGQIAEDVKVHLRQAVNDLRLSGRPAVGSVWDGAETARLLRAHGWLDHDGTYTGPTTIGS